jgi:hypothetical protein
MTCPLLAILSLSGIKGKAKLHAGSQEIELCTTLKAIRKRMYLVVAALHPWDQTINKLTNIRALYRIVWITDIVYKVRG